MKFVTSKTCHWILYYSPLRYITMVVLYNHTYTMSASFTLSITLPLLHYVDNDDDDDDDDDDDNDDDDDDDDDKLFLRNRVQHNLNLQLDFAD